MGRPIGRRRNYRRERSPDPRPWTPAEDEKIIEITRIGLASQFWYLALPDRRFGDILERRWHLQQSGLCPKTRPI